MKVEVFDNRAKNINNTEEYLNVITQDGLVYFNEFRISDVIIVKLSDDIYRMEIDIKSFEGPYSSREKKEFEEKLNTELNSSVQYAWLSMKYASVKMESLEEIQNLELELKNGYNEITDRYLSIYFGWDIELNNNKLKFEKINNSVFLNWIATSEDIDYYDERSKKSTHEFRMKVNIVELDNVDLIDERRKKIANRTIRYNEIVRCMSGYKLTGKYPTIHEPINEEIEIRHKKEAWFKTPEIMRKYPKPDFIDRACC